MEKTEVLVIGAGPAGCIAAALLHKQGVKVRVVEKEKFPRFVIGESLLPRVMDHLDEAGLLSAVKAAGFQEKFGAKFIREKEVCDFNFSEQFSNGWTWTWQVPRAEFDQILSDTVSSMGVGIEFETTVTGIRFDETDSVTEVVDAKGNKKQISARFIIDASGYGRVIPRLFNLDEPSSLGKRKTHFTHFKDLKRPGGIDGNRITVVVHQQRVWIWIIPFSNGVTSVGFVGDPEFFEHMPQDPAERMRYLVSLNENTGERFHDAEMAFEPKTIEGYSISTKQLFGKGYVLVGNATEFLDPVFSSGVTFAMESGAKAGKLAARFLKGEQVDWTEEYANYMMRGINTFRTYVSGWYTGELHEIFFSGNQDPEIKKQICSVLAGYVWDIANPFVKKHEQAIRSLYQVVQLSK